MRGKGAIIAPPEVVSKYGPPPGGGKISPKQGVPYQTVDPQRPSTTPDPRSGGSAAVAPVPAAPSKALAATVPVVPMPEPPKRGLVVLVEPTRIVVDLTAVDGLQAGTLLSVRRDRIPIVHPTTGEVLGELDDEVAIVRVVEVRERFSVAEVQSVATGSQVQVKDRVFLK